MSEPPIRPVATTGAGWTAVWSGRGWQAHALWPLTVPYRALVALRRACYRWGWCRSVRLDVPVIVVGNVIAGGAGKTPVVLELVRWCAGRGIAAGIVSRGYGRTARDCREVRPDSDPADVGDEPLLLARATGLPVFVAPLRAAAAQALLQRHPGTRLIVCDDGLQHLALQRDLEICVFDDRATGNGWLLPAGPLREPWPRRVDFVLRTLGAQPHPGATRPTIAPALMQPGAPVFDAVRTLARHAVNNHGATLDLRTLAGAPATAVCGIARPERFFSMLRTAGIVLQRTTALADHDAFAGFLDAQASGGATDPLPLLCTEKDAPKLWKLRPDAWAVPLVCTLDTGFWVALEQWLEARETA